MEIRTVTVGGRPEEILAAEQTGFSLQLQGAGREVTELETVTARRAPRGNTGCRADRIFSATTGRRKGSYGTGIGG